MDLGGLEDPDLEGLGGLEEELGSRLEEEIMQDLNSFNDNTTIFPGNLDLRVNNLFFIP